MKCHRTLSLLTAAASIAALFATGPQALAAAPHTGTASVTRTGSAGHSLTRQTAVSTNGRGGYSANSSWTGGNGQTLATRQSSGSYNAGTQSYSRSGGTTFANGKQSSFSSSTRATGQGGFTQGRVTTGPYGNSASESRTVTAH